MQLQLGSTAAMCLELDGDVGVDVQRGKTAALRDKARSVVPLFADDTDIRLLEAGARYLFRSALRRHDMLVWLLPMRCISYEVSLVLMTTLLSYQSQRLSFLYSINS